MKVSLELHNVSHLRYSVVLEDDETILLVRISQSLSKKRVGYLKLTIYLTPKSVALLRSECVLVDSTPLSRGVNSLSTT